jgi:hypothetical protein
MKVPEAEEKVREPAIPPIRNPKGGRPYAEGQAQIPGMHCYFDGNSYDNADVVQRELGREILNHARGDFFEGKVPYHATKGRG